MLVLDVICNLWGKGVDKKMLKATFQSIQNKLANKFISLPEEFKDELGMELLHLNVSRDKILLIILLVLDTFFFCISTYTMKVWNGKVIIFGRYSYLHALMIGVALVFLLICYFKKEIKEKDRPLFKALHLTACMMVLVLSSLIAGQNEEINKQAFSYIIVLFGVSSVIYLSRFERILVYSLSYIFYITEIYVIQINIFQRIEDIFYYSILNLLAFIVVDLNYSSYIKNFINRKDISKKNEEIDSLYRITEENLKKRTEELNATVEYDNLRTAFFANISHELRTPLTVIFSAQQMIEYNMNRTETSVKVDGVKDYTHIIKQNCYRLIRLIANFIDITKIDAKYLYADFQNIDIVKIVEDITMSVATYMDDKEINLIFDTETEECIIACDPDKIERIMLNLLSNAIKFTPSEGEVNVNIYDYEDKVAISVKDTGLGIPEAMKESIFERFVQVDKTISRCREGSGIGLSIVKSLVEMHNGNISLRSEQGMGSEFIIEIPKTRVSEISRKKEYNFINENQNIEKINIEFSDIYK